MKKLTYLNCVLTVIAFCLVMLTLSAFHVFPAAYAKPVNKPYVSVPVNADGTINVNIISIAGEKITPNSSLSGEKAGSLPTRPSR